MTLRDLGIAIAAFILVALAILGVTVFFDHSEPQEEDEDQKKEELAKEFRLSWIEAELVRLENLATPARILAVEHATTIEGVQSQLADIPDEKAINARIADAASIATEAKRAAATVGARVQEAINRREATEGRLASLDERVRLLAEAHSVSAEEATEAFLAGGEPALASLMLSEVAGVITTPSPREFEGPIAELQKLEASAWAESQAAVQEADRDRVAAVQARVVAENATAAADAAGTNGQAIPLRGKAVEAAERSRELAASVKEAESQATVDLRRAQALARRAEAMEKAKAHLADLAARIEANGG